MTRAEFRQAVIERDRANRHGEGHHILGRAKPRGWRELLEPLKSAWPDVPMNGIVLTLEEHRPLVMSRVERPSGACSSGSWRIMGIGYGEGAPIETG